MSKDMCWFSHKFHSFESKCIFEKRGEMGTDEAPTRHYASSTLTGTGLRIVSMTTEVMAA